MMDEHTSLIAPPGDDDSYQDIEHVWTKNDEEGPSFNFGFFAASLLGMFISFCDDSFVISTHEEIASSFDQLSISHWLVTAFNLGWAIALPTYGRLYDNYGGKPTLLAAYFLCTVGCAITGTANSVQIAVVGRFMSGIGSAGVTDLISVIINEIAPLRKVAELRMYIGAVSMLGVGSGAPLGGLITSLVGWRWSFLGQVPILLLCSVMVALQHPKDAAETQHAIQGQIRSHKSRSMDIFGLIFLGTAVSSFILLCSAFTEKSYLSEIRWEILAALVTSGALFLVNEAFWTMDPLIPLKLVTINGIGLVWNAQILLNIAMFCLMTNFGEFFVRSEYAQNSKVGFYMIPFSLGLVAGSMLGGQYMKRTGRYKVLSLACLTLSLINVLLIELRWPLGPSHWEIIYTFFMSMGLGGVFATQFVALSAASPREYSSTAVTAYYTSQQLGMVGGATVGATASRVLFRRNLLNKLGASADALRVIQKVLSNTRFAQSLPGHAEHIIRSTYLESFSIVPVISLCAQLLVFPIIASQKERALD